MNLKIYLSGSIKKGDKDESKKSYWTDNDISILRKVLSPRYDLTILNPAVRSDDLSDFKSTFGRDLLQVFASDLIIVDARDKKGLGIGSEMTFAKANGIPVISVTPKNSQYNRTNFEYLGQKMDKWIHPFIGGLSDYMLESVEDAAKFILNNFPFNKSEIKNVDYLYEAMQYYVDTQLKADVEMYNLVKDDVTINERIGKIKEFL